MISFAYPFEESICSTIDSCSYEGHGGNRERVITVDLGKRTSAKDVALSTERNRSVDGCGIQDRPSLLAMLISFRTWCNSTHRSYLPRHAGGDI